MLPRFIYAVLLVNAVIVNAVPFQHDRRAPDGPDQNQPPPPPPAAPIAAVLQHFPLPPGVAHFGAHQPLPAPAPAPAQGGGQGGGTAPVRGGARGGARGGRGRGGSCSRSMNTFELVLALDGNSKGSRRIRRQTCIVL